MKQKTNRLHFSTRTIAMILSVIMLIGSIATGSMLSTFAAYLKDNVNSDAVSQAADAGSAIAKSAISLQDADENTTANIPAFAEEDKTDLPGFEENGIVRGIKGGLANTGANADIAGTGYTSSQFKVHGSWDNELHSVGSDYTVPLAASTEYTFYFEADNGDRFAESNISVSDSIHDYFIKQDSGKTVSMKLTTGAAGTYTFKCSGMDGSGQTPKFDITYPPEDPSSITWTAAGDNTNLFGTSWDAANTANDLARQNSGTYNGKYIKEYSNVYLKKGDIKFKVVKNHKWTTAYPSSNKVVSVSEAGYYNALIVYDPSDNSVEMTLTASAKYTFTLGTTDHATVTATYGKTTINEGGQIENVPVGVSVSVNVTPDSGYKTDLLSSDPAGAVISGTGDKRTVTMPNNNVTVTAAVAEYQVPIKRVYFYNKFTQYPMVIIYAYHKSGTTITDEIFGSGRTMTKMDNSDIWYIDLPADAYIVFKGEGYSTGELQPWSSHSSAPQYIPGSDRTNPGTGGYWGEYKDRSNVYSVTNGSTMSGENLFTGINATFYDYYVDGEVADGWLTGIKGDEYNIGTENQGWKWLPYGTLNQALSDYADADTENPTRGIPANSITYPLYFGNLKYADDAGDVSNLYNFKKRANNSNGLDPASTAITGLTGQTLTGANTDIHHYKSSATNQNGAAMAIFDEDFLSGNNSQGKQLATILHSPSFPVRKEEYKTIYFDNATAKKTVASGNTILAYIWKSTDTSQNMKVSGTATNNIYAFTIPEGYDSVIFYQASSTATGPNNDNKYTGDLTINFTNPQYNGSNWVAQTASAKTHTYYEYDSTDGKDNAFITNINTTNKTADIDYYPDSAHYAESNSGTKGFFPFDYNNVLQRYTTKRVYLKVTDHWDKDGARFAAYFDGDGVSKEWKSMYRISGTKIFWCDIPTNATQNTTLIFCRMDGSKGTNSWDNKWNQTKDLKCPFDTSVNLFSLNTAGVVDSDWTDAGSWSVYSGNDSSSIGTYASNSANPASHYAHDQGFGMKLEIPFTIGENGLNDDGTAQQFNFSGDDDLWVFVDNNLVLDLGGAHGATTGSINFNTMTATANTAAKMDTSSGPDRNGSFGGSGNAQWFDNTNSSKIHTMTIYYMERGMFDSNLKFGYSFHAIPNLLQVEKKVRTTSDDAHVKVNAGFFTNNNQAGAASNMSDLYIDNGERQVTLFEKAFQHDTFGITQNYPTTLPEGHSDLQYTIGEALTTASKDTDNNFTYTLHNNNDGDQIANFNGQINSGDSITLSETINDNINQFRYKPSLIVYDDARVVNGRSYQFTSGNGSDIGTLKENENGSYTFNFKPSVAVAAGAIEDLRLRARFQNQMKCHDLTLKKVVNSGSPEEDFTFEIKFKFDNSGSDAYIAYPLEINGSKTPIGTDGRVTLKAGQSITMSGIPENAQVQIREITDYSSSYAYTSTTVTTETGDDVAGVAEVSTQDGVQFAMADENVDVEVKNATGEPVYISHSLHPESTGTGGTYVSVDVVQSNGTVRKSYAKTNNVIIVDSQYITYNSTDSLKIVLDAYPDQYNTFMDFYEHISETMRSLTASGTNPTYTMTRSAETGVYQATITIAVKDLFNAKHSQLYTELPFYSKFGKQLVITHKLDMNDSDTAALNSAQTKVRVEIYDNAGSELLASYPGNNQYIGADQEIVIPPEYFKNDVYKVKVYLRTELSDSDFSQFNGFYLYNYQMKWEPDAEIRNYVESITNAGTQEKRWNTSEITFVMSNLFNKDGTPKTSVLPYLSRLYKPDYSYTIKYNYPAYVKSYGYQSYTVKGEFTDYDLSNKMKFDADGLLAFKEDSLATNFINNLTPYEDNFQKKITLTKSSVGTKTATSIAYDVILDASEELLSVQFVLPYAAKSDADSYSPKVENNGIVKKLATDRTVNNTSIYGRSWITQNGIKFPSQVTDANQPEFIEAPLIIYDDNDKPYYFQYWQVMTTAKYGAAAREYTRCYDYEFNLSIFQDCKVTPLYSDTLTFDKLGMPNPPQTWNMYTRFDPDKTRAHYSSTPQNEVTVTFLENSRNQYNNHDYGKIAVLDQNGKFVSWKDPAEMGNTPASRQGAADRIYSDFLLTFDNVKDENGVTVILRDKYKNEPNQMQCGLIIEGVAQLEKDNDEYVVKEDTYYASAKDYEGLSVADIKDYLENGTSLGKTVARSKMDVLELDNKNRIQYYYGLNAMKPKNGSATAPEGAILDVTEASSNKTMVYKAYAYIGKGSANADTLSDVTVSPVPVYFTVYNTASILPGNMTTN